MDDKAYTLTPVDPPIDPPVDLIDPTPREG